MQIGIIGAGNMARALVRGWNRPVLVADPVSERAQALVAEVAGEALATNAEVARRADLVVLCHKPAQLAARCRELAPHAKAIASILAAIPLAALREAYPDRPVYRFIPSLPVEVRRGRRCPGRAERSDTRWMRRSASCSPSSARSSCSRRARRRRDGPDVMRTRLRGARRRGADRRGRAPRDPRRAERGAGRADAGRDGGAAAPPRQRHARRPPRGRLPRGGHRPRACAPWSAGGCARPSATPSTRCCKSETGVDDPRQRAHRHRRIPLDVDLRLHAADHPLHRHPAVVLARFAPALLARDRRRVGFLRDICEPFLRLFRR